MPKFLNWPKGPGFDNEMKLNEREFDRIVKRSIRRIPREIRRHLENILISIQERPAADMLEEMGLPPDEPLLGVFWGVSLAEQSISDPPLFPNTIFLFQEPLEEMCDTIEDLHKNGGGQ